MAHTNSLHLEIISSLKCCKLYVTIKCIFQFVLTIGYTGTWMQWSIDKHSHSKSDILVCYYTMNVHDNYMPKKCFFRNNKLFKFLSESLDLVLQANIPTRFPNSISVSISRFSRFRFFAHFPGNSHSRFSLEQTLPLSHPATIS